MTAFLVSAAAMAGLVLAVLLWPVYAGPTRLFRLSHIPRRAPTPGPDPSPAMTTDANAPPSLQTLRMQLTQIDAMRDNGSLSAELHAQARARLEQQIVAAVMAGDADAGAGAGAGAGAQAAGASAPTAAPTPTPSPATRTRNLRWAAGAAVAVLAVVGGGYATVGQPELWFGAVSTASAGAQTGGGADGPAGAANGSTAPHTMEQAAMQGMVDSLAARLAAQPDDPEGWGMLARSYAVLGQHAQALPAFQRAVAARPDDAVLLADYADALAVTQGRRIEGEPLKLVQRALAADPKQLKALSLAGTAAFDRGDFAGAVKYWERLVQAGPADNALVRQVTPGLADARAKAGLPAGKAVSAAPAADGSIVSALTAALNAPPGTAAASATVAASATAATAASPAKPGSSATTAQVAGRISLAPALAGRAAPDDTVFIYARAAEGSRMPLAILRKQVKDLPLQFRLDDSLAMSPALKLSSQPRVIVSARVSKSGQATPQPGDLVGQTEVVALGRTDLGIQITEVVRP